MSYRNKQIPPVSIIVMNSHCNPFLLSFGKDPWDVDPTLLHVNRIQIHFKFR